MKSKLLIAITTSLALCAAVYTRPARAQSSAGTGVVQGSYTYTPIQLPVSYLLAGAVSNLASGWSSVTSYTNITQVWDPTNLVIAKSTNTVSITNTLYANFPALRSRYVALQWDNHCSGSSTENAYITVVKSVTGANYDTGGATSYTNSANGTSTNGMTFLIDMAGYGYGRVTKMGWLGASVTLTNDGFSSSTKQGASQ